MEKEEASKANIQTVDVAALPHNKDTLKLSFSLRAISGLSTPATCNNPDYQRVLAGYIQQYQQQYGFQALALRYAENIANGRFLWRNRVGAEQLNVIVNVGEACFNFDCYDFKLETFSATAEVQNLANLIAQGLTQDHILLEVDAYAKLGKGQMVYPSQEMVLDMPKVGKSKFLYHLFNQAAMHSQKIGNAIRTIDTWHPAAQEVGPISIEPYGSVTNRGVAYRKDKTDFYHLLDNWLLKGHEPTLEQQHYIMAMLIRGGVFGG